MSWLLPGEDISCGSGTSVKQALGCRGYVILRFSGWMPAQTIASYPLQTAASSLVSVTLLLIPTVESILNYFCSLTRGATNWFTHKTFAGFTLKQAAPLFYSFPFHHRPFVILPKTKLLCYPPATVPLPAHPPYNSPTHLLPNQSQPNRQNQDFCRAGSNVF